jgi:hypothetical protein
MLKIMFDWMSIDKKVTYSAVAFDQISELPK